MTIKLKLSEVLPNPYRDLKNNPLNPETIARLKQSIDSTEFWDNVVVRKNSEGKYEQAYGHHRLEAARQSGIVEADFIVKKFSDEHMLRALHDDNDEAYKFRTASLFEAVRGVVNALAEGKIGPFKTSIQTKAQAAALPYTRKQRFAPSFVPGRKPAGLTSEELSKRTYTILDVARVLNETKDDGNQASSAIKAVVNALHLIEIGQLNEKALVGRPLDSQNGGLIQIVRATFANLAEAKEREEANAYLVKRAQEEKNEAQRKQLQNSQKRLAKVRAEEAKETKKPTLEDPPVPLAVKLKEQKEKTRKNEAAIITEGPKIDAKVAAKAKVDEEEAKRNMAANLLRQRIDAACFKLGVETWEGLFRELDYLIRTVQDTKQRMRLFNAINKLTSQFDEYAKRFPGKPPRQSAKDMLKERYQKEEAKRERTGNESYQGGQD